MYFDFVIVGSCDVYSFTPLSLNLVLSFCFTETRWKARVDVVPVLVVVVMVAVVVVVVVVVVVWGGGGLKSRE